MNLVGQFGGQIGGQHPPKTGKNELTRAVERLKEQHGLTLIDSPKPKVGGSNRRRAIDITHQSNRTGSGLHLISSSTSFTQPASDYERRREPMNVFGKRGRFTIGDHRIFRKYTPDRPIDTSDSHRTWIRNLDTNARRMEAWVFDGL